MLALKGHADLLRYSKLHTPRQATTTTSELVTHSCTFLHTHAHLDLTRVRSGYVPRDKVTVTASRSSGAGGQHVNKVSTKVSLRFKLSEADWLDEYVTASHLTALHPPAARAAASGMAVCEVVLL